MNAEFKKKIDLFLGSIEKQSVTLMNVNFTVHNNMEGSFPDEMLKREFIIQRLNIREGHAEERSSGALLKKKPIVSFVYEGNFSDKIKLKESNQILDLIDIHFSYGINLFLRPDCEFVNYSQNDKRSIIKFFANTTGKLILFPYIRHLIHFLSLEAGCLIPPLNPLPLNQNS